MTASGVVRGDEWTFTTRRGGGLTPGKVRYAPGDTISISFDGGDAARDWIALHARTSAYGAGSPAQVWKYLGNSGSAPGSVIASGNITLLAPSQPGEYVLRFFQDEGYEVEDELAIVIE